MDSGAADSSAGPRARAFLLLPLVLILAAGGWWWVHRGVQETDDAQVQADLTDIASRIPGTIATVSIHDNQSVHRGQLLQHLQRTDPRLQELLVELQRQFSPEHPLTVLSEQLQQQAALLAFGDVFRSVAVLFLLALPLLLLMPAPQSSPQSRSRLA